MLALNVHNQIVVPIEHSDKKTINKSSITCMKHGRSLGLKNSTKKKVKILLLYMIRL